MPNKKNVQEVEVLEKELEGLKAFFLADYSGLPVSAQQELREKVQEAGGKLHVAKNTLLKIALKNKGYNVKNIEKELTGQNITLFAENDPIAPLKVLVEYEEEYEKPSMKAGFLGNEQLSLEKIKELAKLPSKVELIAKLIGQIQAPVYGMVNVLSAPSRNLVYALSAIKDKKGQQ